MTLYKNIISKTIAIAILGFAMTTCSKEDSPSTGKKPAADFSASETSVIEHNTVTFTDLSTNNPTLWTWNFAGASPTYSNEQNPTVIYDVPGLFEVTMTVRNDAGADEITKVDYIEVTGEPIVFLSSYSFAGNLTDDGTNSIDAVSNYGDPVYTDDHSGNASSAWLAPGISTQYLSIPGFKGIGGNGERSVLAWFKTPAVGTRKTIVSWGVNSGGSMFNVMIHGGTVRVEAGASSLRTTRNGLDDDTWHHLAVTFNPADGDKLADVKIYIDGILEQNDPDAASSYRSEVVVINTDGATNDVRIGDANYSANYFFQGSLDDVKITSKALIAEQIQAIMAGNK